MQLGLETSGSEWKRGWRVLAAAFAGMGTGWTFANISASLFLKPMQAEFGWSRTELSFGPRAGMIIAILLPVTGMLLDRFGARRIALIGMVALACAFLFFASIPADSTYFAIAVIVLGISGAACNSVVMASGMAPWFDRSLGTAIGLMMTGASLSAAVVIPVLSIIIESHGWRGGFVTLALMTLCIGLPAILIWFREPTEQTGGMGNSDQPGRDSWRTLLSQPAFWQLAIGSSLAALPIGGFISHMVPLLTDRGIAPVQAAGLASVFAIGVAAGRISNGLLLDRFHPPLVTATTLLLAGVGATIFYGSHVAVMPFAVLGATIVLIGLAQGAEGDYSKFFSMRLFGRSNFPRVAAIMAMTISMSMALGGIIFAKVHDVFGSYSIALGGGVILYGLAGLTFLSIRMKRAEGSAAPGRSLQPESRPQPGS